MAKVINELLIPDLANMVFDYLMPSKEDCKEKMDKVVQGLRNVVDVYKFENINDLRFYKFYLSKGRRERREDEYDVEELSDSEWDGTVSYSTAFGNTDTE